jgi:hypothetical protein
MPAGVPALVGPCLMAAKRLDGQTRMQIDALRRRRQMIAFDANVQRIYQIGTPYTIACLEEYEKLTRAIEALEIPSQGETVQGRLF